MKMTPVDFVKKYTPYAKEIEQKSKIPALFILAQSALESGWGKSAIGNNLFGITANDSWKGLKQLIQTTEFHDNMNVRYPEIISITKLDTGKYKYIVKRWFRDYETPAGCFEDHMKILLLPRYAEAFKYTYDLKRFAEEIARGGYATAPDYANTIVSVSNTVKRALIAAGIEL